jgi:hypothetical protein
MMNYLSEYPMFKESYIPDTDKMWTYVMLYIHYRFQFPNFE